MSCFHLSSRVLVGLTSGFANHPPVPHELVPIDSTTLENGHSATSLIGIVFRFLLCLLLTFLSYRNDVSTVLLAVVLALALSGKWLAAIFPGADLEMNIPQQIYCGGGPDGFEAIIVYVSVMRKLGCPREIDPRTRPVTNTADEGRPQVSLRFPEICGIGYRRMFSPVG